MWLKISAYLNLSPTGVCSPFVFTRRQLVTLFSAPSYCGEFGFAGAMMSVDENETHMCSFQVLMN